MTKLQPVNMLRKPIAAAIITGALAGLVASVPMGLAMMGLERWLPGRTVQAGRRSLLTFKSPLPPKQIFAKVMQRAGKDELVEAGRRWDAPTWLAHLGYGALAASAYPLLTRRLHWPAVLRGMVFALGVWALSYQGWLPAARILPPSTDLPVRRNTVMIVSHLIWGALLSLIETNLRKEYYESKSQTY